MIDVLFRADDGPGIGAGHLMRCLALAEAVRAAGGRAHLMCRTNSPLHRNWRTDGARVETHDLSIGGREDMEVTARFARTVSADWLVADGYAFDVIWLEALAEGHRVLYLDDLGGRDAAVSLVLNQNAGAEIRYRAAYSRVGRALLGLEWFLLRRGWRALIPRPEPGRLLVTLGGDDRDNLALALMMALLADGCAFHADVVSSAPEAGFQAAFELASAYADRFTLHRAPVDLALLMARASVVVCGGGVTPVEAASLGVPSVIKVLADNQAPGAQTLALEGAARVVAVDGDEGITDVAGLALDLLADDTARAVFAERARALVDGNGAARVVAVMTEAMQ